MIKTFVTHDSVCREQPKLQDFIRGGTKDWERIIDLTYNKLLIDLRNLQLDVKKLQTPLNVPFDNPTAGVFTGEASSKDYVNRSVFYISGTNLTELESYELQGSDDQTTWTTVLDDIRLDTNGEETAYQISDFYHYYRLKRELGAEGVPNANLIEGVYHYLHLYLAISHVYSTLKRTSQDDWAMQQLEYENMYKDLLTGSIYTFDHDADGEVKSVRNKRIYTRV